MLEVGGVHRIVLVVRPEDRAAIREAVAPHLGAHDLWVVDGGTHRHDSEWQALRTLAADIEDGEIERRRDPRRRPAVGARIAVAGRHRRRSRARGRDPGAADTPPLPPRRLGRARGAGRRADTPGLPGPRSCSTRTAAPRRTGFVGTDTAACLERYADVVVVGVPSTAANLKVTFPEDVALAESLLSQSS